MLFAVDGLSDTDRQIVKKTLEAVTPSEASQIRHIHEEALRQAHANRDRLLREIRAVNRAIAMRELALELLGGVHWGCSLPAYDELVDSVDRSLATGAATGRSPECVAAWPECHDGGYDPRCCRFPKSCSCTSNLAAGEPVPPGGDDAGGVPSSAPPAVSPDAERPNGPHLLPWDAA